MWSSGLRSASPIDPRGSRAERIRALAYGYTSQPAREVEACNLCGATVFTVLTHRDRYGYPATACGCRRCGLVFLNPVMTSEAYSRFYVDVYRPLVSAYHGRLIDATTIQAEQRDYARERGDLLAPYLDGKGFATMLDIGGSTGVVAHAFCERFGLKGTVIDPSPLEIDEARRLGLDTVTGLVEEWHAGGQSFDVVVMAQTVDHLLDIARTLAAVRGIIRPGGVFFVDIVDFRAAYLRNGSVEDAMKIDHPYYLTDFTMEAFLSRAGFDVVRADYAADHLHISYVCRPGSADGSAFPPPESVSALWHEVRYVQNAPRP
jgi:SAM-dependent methyltransferase